MFNIDISKYVPSFIMNDKNGYALAKAIEKALQIFNNKCNTATKIIYDISSMPEWRLDEIAWETQCFYDYSAEISVKRKWITDAIKLYRLHGTKQAMKNYLNAYFTDVEILENWEYNGNAYNFQVIAPGDWNKEKAEWLSKAVNTSKNLRSVIDFAGPGTHGYLGFVSKSEILKVSAPYAMDDFYSGTWPENEEETDE